MSHDAGRCDTYVEGLLRITRAHQRSKRYAHLRDCGGDDFQWTHSAQLGGDKRVCMAVYEAGQKRGLAQIDHYDIFRRMRSRLRPGTDLFDLFAFGQNSLVEQVFSALHVEHAARFDQLGFWRWRWPQAHLGL